MRALRIDEISMCRSRTSSKDDETVSPIRIGNLNALNVEKNLGRLNPRTAGVTHCLHNDWRFSRIQSRERQSR